MKIRPFVAVSVTAITFLTTSARAESFYSTRASTGAYPIVYNQEVPPGCVGNTVTGTEFATSSIQCEMSGFGFWAKSTALSGIGPLKIGVVVTTNPGPMYGYGYVGLDTSASGEATWKGNVVTKGRTGKSGYIQFLYTAGGSPYVWSSMIFNGIPVVCWHGGCSYPPGGDASADSTVLVPIVFGEEHPLSLSTLSIHHNEYTGPNGELKEAFLIVTGVRLYDEDGKLLLHEKFDVVPEPTSDDLTKNR